MKTFSLAALLALCLVMPPLGSVAQASGMQGMAMQGDMVKIGEQVVDGVKAMAYIMVYGESARASMAKMGMETTHHLMMLFVDEQSGRPITGGAAALKVRNQNGETGKAIKLMAMKMKMGAGFGSDFSLPEKGEFTFLVGTKLDDGKKRRFEFRFEEK
jgi:hypothetical protein